MKRFLLIIAFALMLCGYSSATMTRVQHKTKTACGTSCAVTVTSTGTGNLLVAGCFAPTTTTSKGCTAVSGGGTWVHPTGCVATSSTAIGLTDFWYSLSSTSGATTVTVTFGNANGTANEVWVEEISSTATPFTFGACAVLSNQAATSSPSIPTISPSGVANAMFGVVFTQSTINAGSAASGTGWTNPLVDAPGGDGANDGLDFAGGSTTGHLTSIATGAYCSSGIWFSDASTGGGGGGSGPACTLTTMGAGAC